MTPSRPYLLIAAAGLAAVLISPPAAAQELDLERLEAVADSVAHHHIASDVAPGIAVAVVRDGEVLFQKGYGRADAELGVAAGPETRPVPTLGRAGPSNT